MTKEDLIDLIDGDNKDTFSKGEIISSLKKLILPSAKPNCVKKGDIFLSIVSTKLRPCVVVKVDNNNGITYAIPLTTTDDFRNMCECKGRFYNGSFFTNNIIVSTVDYTIKMYVGVYDHQKSLESAIKEIKNIVNNF